MLGLLKKNVSINWNLPAISQTSKNNTKIKSLQNVTK